MDIAETPRGIAAGQNCHFVTGIGAYGERSLYITSDARRLQIDFDKNESDALLLRAVID